MKLHVGLQIGAVWADINTEKKEGKKRKKVIISTKEALASDRAVNYSSYMSKRAFGLHEIKKETAFFFSSESTTMESASSSKADV